MYYGSGTVGGNDHFINCRYSIERRAYAAAAACGSVRPPHAILKEWRSLSEIRLLNRCVST